MAGYTYTYTWLVAPYSTYPDTGGVEMNNGVIASTSSGNYSGWQNFGSTVRDLVRIDLGSPVKVGEVVVHYADSLSASGVSAPGKLEAWVSNDNVTYTKVAEIVPSASDTADGPAPWGGSAAKTRGAVLGMNNEVARYVKLRANAIDQWFMLSEIEVLHPMARVAGLATLDTGAAASYVLIRNWDTHAHLGKVFPQVDGTWEYLTRTALCEVTVVGPAGYQPVTHGPVASVEQT